MERETPLHGTTKQSRWQTDLTPRCLVGFMGLLYILLFIVFLMAVSWHFQYVRTEEYPILRTIQTDHNVLVTTKDEYGESYPDEFGRISNTRKMVGMYGFAVDHYDNNKRQRVVDIGAQMVCFRNVTDGSSGLSLKVKSPDGSTGSGLTIYGNTLWIGDHFKFQNIHSREPRVSTESCGVRPCNNLTQTQLMETLRIFADTVSVGLNREMHRTLYNANEFQRVYKGVITSTSSMDIAEMTMLTVEMMQQSIRLQLNMMQMLTEIRVMVMESKK